VNGKVVEQVFESGPVGGPSDSLFDKFSEFVDTKAGTLKFKGKAVIHGKGIEFSSGSSFSISLDEVDNLEELGKGNYGTVYRVRHSRPQMRRPGLGLKGNRPPPSLSASSTATSSPVTPASADTGDDATQQNSASSTATMGQGNTTGVVMAMKEIRLELDEAKFAAIIMELDILHRCISPFIIDFYGLSSRKVQYTSAWSIWTVGLLTNSTEMAYRKVF
jgi:mitogen-activated protein kinase kinase